MYRTWLPRNKSNCFSLVNRQQHSAGANRVRREEKGNKSTGSEGRGRVGGKCHLTRREEQSVETDSGGERWGDMGDKGQWREVRSPSEDSWRSDMTGLNSDMGQWYTNRLYADPVAQPLFALHYFELLHYLLTAIFHPVYHPWPLFGGGECKTGGTQTFQNFNFPLPVTHFENHSSFRFKSTTVSSCQMYHCPYFCKFSRQQATGTRLSPAL